MEGLNDRVTASTAALRRLARTYAGYREGRIGAINAYADAVIIRNQLERIADGQDTAEWDQPIRMSWGGQVVDAIVQDETNPEPADSPDLDITALVADVNRRAIRGEISLPTAKRELFVLKVLRMAMAMSGRTPPTIICFVCGDREMTKG